MDDYFTKLKINFFDQIFTSVSLTDYDECICISVMMFCISLCHSYDEQYIKDISEIRFHQLLMIMLMQKHCNSPWLLSIDSDMTIKLVVHSGINHSPVEIKQYTNISVILSHGNKAHRITV